MYHDGLPHYHWMSIFIIWQCFLFWRIKYYVLASHLFFHQSAVEGKVQCWQSGALVFLSTKYQWLDNQKTFNILEVKNPIWSTPRSKMTLLFAFNVLLSPYQFYRRHPTDFFHEQSAYCTFLRSSSPLSLVWQRQASFLFCFKLQSLSGI